MTTTSLNYHALLHHMIKTCIEHAKNNPFEKHYFISNNPDIIEQCFFQYTNILVNIEVLTFQDYLKQMIIEYHYNYHTIINKTHLTFLLRKILSEKQFTCFSCDNPYPLIDKFIPVMKTYDLYELDYDLNHNKLNDLLLLYKSLKEHLKDNEHITLESIFDDCLFNHQRSSIYIDGTYLTTKKHINIINKLKINHDVHMFYTYNNDQRLFNLPFHSFINENNIVENHNVLLEQLFLEKITKKDDSDHYYSFISSTIHNEVNEVIYHIYQKIADNNLKYSDFAIIYPSNDYIHIILDILDSLNLPHHLQYEESCVYEEDYKRIINDNHIYDYRSFKEFAQYFLSLELSSSYQSYFEQLKDYNDLIDYKEFIQFFMFTYNKNKQTQNNNKDYIQVCSIDNALFDHPKHVYYLGLNETVFPKRIKDTSLLLDEDLNVLKGHRPFNTTEQLGLHHNSIIKALSFPCLSVTFSYSLSKLSNETLLESSLFKQLKSILNLKDKDKNKYLSTEDFYLKGGSYEDKDILNNNIRQFIESKNNVNPLDKQLISKIYASHLSVSQIEAYNKCPFMYFIKYGLKITPSYSSELQANEIGTLVHHVLELCIDTDLNIDDVIEDYIRSEPIIQKKISESDINRYFIDCLKDDLKITLYVLQKQNKISSFNVLEKEREINNELNGLSFKGFVDRVDQFEDYISIIDYKSSAKDIDLNLAMQGFNIQMLVYLKMVSEDLGKIPGGVLYFNTKKRVLSAKTRLYEPIDEIEFDKQYRLNGYISDNESHDVIHAIDPHMDRKSNIVNVTYVKSRNEYTGNILSIESMNLLFDYICSHISELYSQMIQGHIEICPKGSDQSTTHTLINPCTYCDYKCICNFDHFYNEYKNVEFLDVEKMLGGEDDAV